MKLEDIGFYTLSDYRAKNASSNSPLQRCELIITDACNFKCPYCRGVRADFAGHLKADVAFRVLEYWISQGLVNVRFSGGEPTLHRSLPEFIRYCAEHSVKRIAVSSNGSATKAKYEELLNAGTNDFSISLDACCASTGDTMAGVCGYYDTILENIEFLSKRTYTTVGVVLTGQNAAEVMKTVELASSLGVADIRVIPAAQVSDCLGSLNADQNLLAKHPILKYRAGNSRVRGLSVLDNNRCPLVLDDMAVVKGYHFPCIIYMREGGNPIGKIGPNTRLERKEWAEKHDTHSDTICKNNCLDVCVAYNNKHKALNAEVL